VTVESLQSHCIHTQFHWSDGPPVCILSWDLYKNGILLLALSCYIGDPDVLHPEPSLGRHADNVIIPLDLTQPSCPGFTPAAGPPSSFTTTAAGGESCGEPAISMHSYTVPLVQWSTRLLPVLRGPGSVSRGVFMRNWEPPVSVVLLHDMY
jgi:hypothetical protein